jgi:CBS domain containing-hemolysin-like protein
MIPFLLENPTLPILFLIGSALLTGCSSALLSLGKFKSKELLRAADGPHFFFRHLLKKLFLHNEWENIYFMISVSKHIYELAYAATSFFYLTAVAHDWILLAAVCVIGVSVLLDFVMRLLGNLAAKPLLKIAAPFGSLYLIALFPLTALLLKLIRSFLQKVPYEEKPSDTQKLREMIRESDLQQHLDPSDQKLIASFINFKQRVAKEIMVPRVDIFSLAAETPIREAVHLFAKEGYSRIPIYKESLDQIIGVALYKDLLKYYSDPSSDLNGPIESLAKPVIYSPENKKISQLLQEFRNKQLHIAIIVDEYGGTEGIVTIEDILEELVGEIEDEYDIDEAKEFWELPEGGWVVDAKMTLIDIENQLGIRIPENPDYETIGGYVFHCAGTIPSKGWRLSHDEFDLEVLSSNERSLKKIKILPRRPS